MKYFNIGCFILCVIFFLSMFYSVPAIYYAIQKHNVKNDKKYFSLEYIDGQKSTYYLKECEVEILPHLNLIKIHTKWADDTATVYVPMHNLRFFGIAEAH